MKPMTCLALCAAMAGAAGAARAEIAADLNADHLVFLYVLDGTDLVRTLCDRDAAIYDHATCAKAVRRVPAHRVFEASARTYGGDLPEFSARLGQLKTGLDRLDTRLGESLATPAGPATQALRDEVERLTRALAQADVRVRDLADQVARLNAAIAAGDAVAEDQLRITGAAHAEAVKAEAGAASDLQDARKALIDAASTSPDSTFQGLLADRKRLKDAFASTKRDLELEVEEAVGLSTLYKRLADANFVYVHLLSDRNYEDTFKVLCGHDYPSCSWQQDSFDKHFRNIDEELRKFEGVASADHTVVTTAIPRDDGVERAECAFDVTTEFGNPCGPMIRVRGPNGYDVTVDATNTSGENFQALPWARYGNVSDELWHTLVGARSQGTWRVEFFCQTGAVRQVTAASCKFEVLRRELWGSLCPQDSPGVTPAPCQLDPIIH